MTTNDGREANAAIEWLAGELITLQRWAGGDGVSLAKLHGFVNRIESVMNEEVPSLITCEEQREVEDMLDLIDRGKLTTDGMTIKKYMVRKGIDEVVASKIIRLCYLQNRFPDVIEKLDQPDSHFHGVLDSPVSTDAWYGATHYVEIADTSGHTKPMSVLSPCVPRIGEIVETHHGSPMRVIEVVYHAQPDNDPLNPHRRAVLVPTVMLEPIEDPSEGSE